MALEESRIRDLRSFLVVAVVAIFGGNLRGRILLLLVGFSYTACMLRPLPEPPPMASSHLDHL